MCKIDAGANAARGLNAALDSVRAHLICVGAKTTENHDYTLDLKGRAFDGAQLTVAAVTGFLEGYAACHDEGCMLRALLEAISNDARKVALENS